MDKCPCCGQRLPESTIDAAFVDKYFAITRNGQCAVLTATQYRIATAIRRRGMTRDELIDFLYEGREDGGPETAVSVFHVTVKNANDRLKPLGLKIGSDSLGKQQTPYRLRVLNA